MNQVPVWVAVLQGLTTPAIAAAVGYIALRQWRTAQQKMVLDLFDRRFAVFLQIRKMRRTLTGKHTAVPAHEIDELHQTRAEAQFLFGDEVLAKLKDIHWNLIDMSVAYNGATAVEGQEAFAKLHAAHQFYNAAMRGIDELPEHLQAYMRLDTQLPRTLPEWIRDRNELRLSYADPPTPAPSSPTSA